MNERCVFDGGEGGISKHLRERERQGEGERKERGRGKRDFKRIKWKRVKGNLFFFCRIFN